MAADGKQELEADEAAREAELREAEAQEQQSWFELERELEAER